MWRAEVIESLSNGRVWVVIPSRSGEDPVGPLTAVPAGLARGDAVLVTATDPRGVELTVISRAGEDGPAAVTWEQITGKPATFAPAPHTHAWGEITGKPTTFAPATHSHTWASITSKPTTFAPAAHTHAMGDVTVWSLGAAVDLNDYTTQNVYHQAANVNAAAGSNYPAPLAGLLEVFAASSMVYQRYTAYNGSGVWWRVKYTTTWFAWYQVERVGHTHTAAQISDSTAVGRGVLTAASDVAARSAIGAGTSSLELGSTASTAKPGNYVPTWTEVSGKPSTFAPSTHTHTWAQITGAPATYAPSAHSHAAGDVASGVLAAARLPAASSSEQGAQSPTHFDMLNSATDSLLNNALIRRGAGGSFELPPPPGPDYAVNKQYVDGQVDTRAASSHTHAATDVTSGTFAAARLPVATTSAQGAMPAADRALMATATSAATANALARRDSSGRLSVATPTLSTHAVTKAYVDDGGATPSWTNLSLASGWTAEGDGTAPPRYRIEGKRVYLDGVLNNPPSIGAVAFTLPTAARPAYKKYLNVTPWAPHTGSWRMEVTTGGVVSFPGVLTTAQFVPMDGIYFDLD